MRERWTALLRGLVRAKRNAAAPKNAPRETSEPVPFADILASIRRLERSSGRASLTAIERWIIDAHGVAKHALGSGGFEHYFAVCPEPHIWNDTCTALCAMKREGAAAVLRQAIQLYTSHDHDDDDLLETRRYLTMMAHLNSSFRELMRSFEADLSCHAYRYYRSPDSQLVHKARLKPTSIKRR